MNKFRMVLSVLILSVSNFTIADSMSDDERWLNDDSDFLSLEVNEGELTFLKPISHKRTLHSDTVITISKQSISTGWVGLKQCYFDINPAIETDVVYKYKNIKNIRILSFSSIANTHLEEQVIHLSGIGKNASLCVAADVNVFKKMGLNTYSVSNGPHQLKFLDGYYPYHITLTVKYEPDVIEIRNVYPESQALFDVKLGKGSMYIDSWFEGILTIYVEFEKVLLSSQYHENAMR